MQKTHLEALITVTITVEVKYLLVTVSRFISHTHSNLMHVSFLPFSSRSGVRLIPFVLHLQIRLLYQTLMIDEYVALVD